MKFNQICKAKQPYICSLQSLTTIVYQESRQLKRNFIDLIKNLKTSIFMVEHPTGRDVVSLKVDVLEKVIFKCCKKLIRLSLCMVTQTFT